MKINEKKFFDLLPSLLKKQMYPISDLLQIWCFSFCNLIIAGTWLTDNFIVPIKQATNFSLWLMCSNCQVYEYEFLH